MNNIKLEIGLLTKYIKYSRSGKYTRSQGQHDTNEELAFEKINRETIFTIIHFEDEKKSDVSNGNFTMSS